MAPASDRFNLYNTELRTENPVKRAWKEDRIDLPSNLLGRSQGNSSTARHDLEEGLNSPRQRSSERQQGRGRKNSLKNVKNSNEVLRQRSLKRGNKEALDPQLSMREGRHFAVANVGNNGKIYLRPTQRPSQTHQPPPSSFPLKTPTSKAGEESDRESSGEKKRWSDTQASRTPSRRPHEKTLNRKPQRSTSISGQSARTSHDSLSTIGADLEVEQGAYKIIINNNTSQSPPVDENGLPSLAVPIPHYRLGTPRFSTQGTAFLHSTVYSRTSTTDDLHSASLSGPELDNIFPIPPGMDSRTVISRTQSQHQMKPPPSRGVPMRMPIVTTAPVFHKAREPIVPSIFDAISENPDSPAIVRYAMTTREISAASPARIITQVTSKNFLDYELLSDFFLTARAYLSTNDLLEYLLARFEWAINRFDDDGRVIRVRTFAAIRHWILNYFPYDFVVDRDLRVKFSERLNALTLHVRLRGHEASDLKLIIDLKKCWNGRCALYWDSPQEEIEGRIDHDISPGGIVGSRDSQLTHPNELWAKLAAASSNKIDPEKSAAALHNWVDSVIEAEVDGKSRSERQASVASPTHSASLLSDQTIPAMSCTVPGKTFKSFANQAGRNVGPHPVPVSTPTSTRRVCPPAPSAHVKERSSRKKSDHQRSGSFSDALRDKRTSLGAIHEGKSTEQVVMSLPFSGSLIRGSVFPPGSPFIPSDDVKSRGSGSSLKKEEQYPCLPPETHPMSPGVRSLLVYLRRAWGSKQNSVSTTPAIMPTAPFMIETKYSNLPMHIAYKIEGLGDQHNQLEALKNNARIDLLCADVTDMFERAMTQEEKQISAKPSKVSLASSKDIEVASRDSWQYLTTPEREGLRRNHSEVTTGSRSIVIMDDTSSQPPVPDLPRSFNKPHAPFSLGDQGGTPQYKPLIPPKSPERANRSGDTTQSSLQPEFTRPNPFRPHQQRESLNQGPPTSRISTQPRRPSVTTANSFRSTRSGSTSLRKYVSYQSGMRRSGPDQMFDPTNESSSSPGQVDRPPARMLRRRPGGDLRANENVNDMKTIPRPLSTGSITTYTDSMRYSSNYLQRMPHEANNRASEDDHRRGSTPVPKRSRSVEHDRSSRKKDLRPSFELAVAAFARIPDDEGGDLEATLLKLEGRFRRSPVGSSEGPSSARPTPPATSHSREQPPPIPQNGLCPNNTLLTPPPSAKRLGEPEVAKGQHDTTQSLYTASEGSYNSVPLLERGNENKRAQGSQAASDQLNETVPRPLFSPNDPYRKDRSESSAWGSEIDSTTRVRRGRYRSSIPTMTTDSFLLDEDEFLSDLSSELSDDEDFETDSVLEDAYGSAARTMQNHSMPSLPPNVGYASGYLPSPPMTTENAIAISSETFRMQEQRKPPTPEPSPVSRHTESAKSRTPNEVDGSVLQPFANKVHQFPPRRHIPFVLAFDATVLAQQFTLIERDALNEINWQDLIDLRWQQSSPTALNWVEFLRYQDPNGIDLVTARFNIVVKWALSEIVLTHNVEERAWTIMKFIRVAQHARKYHNYATMLQLTLALTSIDCTRMTKAWALVPEAERAAMKEMESLVSPLRNFHNLRAEMEAANFDDGCIPVVALFLHDLTYNSQKPSVIASTRDAEPLINFERYRTTATIVKSLLRLIDSSAKYDFKPVEGALERCLWMASLSDDGIRAKSREVEPGVTPDRP